MNCIFGVAGFAKEVDWLINDLYLNDGTDFRPDFFVVENENSLIGSYLNSCEIISEIEFFKKFFRTSTNSFIAVGSPKIKKKIESNIKTNIKSGSFPNLIHPSVSWDRRKDKLILGEGNIICSQSVLTTEIKIGNFVHINLDCTVGHESSIGSYSTVSPGVHISGNVSIGENVFIGTGAVILERVTVCSDVIIGAGATVVKSIMEPGTYVGTPAVKNK